MSDPNRRGGPPDQTNKTSGTTRAGDRPRRVVAAVRGALVGLAQSRGLFAVLGATVATTIFVLFSGFPGNESPLLAPPDGADRTVDVDAGAGADTANVAEQTSQGRDLEPDRSAAQPSLSQAPLAEPAPAQPAPEEPSPTQQAHEQPMPGQPAPEGPVRTPYSRPPAPEQERTVVLSTKAGHDSVEIDRWRTVRSEAADLRMDRAGIYTMLGAQLSVIADPHEALTYHDCAQRTTWVTRVNFATLHEGSALCARSRTGNYAALNVITLPRSTRHNDMFVFHATTWQAPEPRRTPPSSSPSAQPMPLQHG